MFKQLIPAFRFTLALTILTGLLYPGLVTGLAQMIFPHQAHGSLIKDGDKVVGSELIGQVFSKPEYFQPRPSAAGSDGYDGASSSGSNLGTTSKKLADRVAASAEAFRKDNPDFKGPIPADLITSSASGLDPDLSPASAEAQASRVAKARGVALEQINQLIAQSTAGPDLGFLGEPRVNVLLLNRELDKKYPTKK